MPRDDYSGRRISRFFRRVGQTIRRENRMRAWTMLDKTELIRRTRTPVSYECGAARVAPRFSDACKIISRIYCKLRVRSRERYHAPALARVTSFDRALSADRCYRIRSPLSAIAAIVCKLKLSPRLNPTYSSNKTTKRTVSPRSENIDTQSCLVAIFPSAVPRRCAPLLRNTP